MRRHRKVKEVLLDEPLVNLTPLIDVVFVVLIMFIIVVPMLELDRVELASGNDSSLEVLSHMDEGSTLSIHVTEDNRIWFRSKELSEKNLQSILREEKKVHANARLQVFHDHRAQFGTYQLVKNAATNAGFSQMDVILKPS